MRSPNIGLQRTSRRSRAAAEAGSLGATRVVRSLLFASLVILSGGLGCREQKSHWGSTEFMARIRHLELANACEEAFTLVQAENARTDPRWYELLIELRLDCQAKTRQPRYAEEALDLANAGIVRFPDSSKLLFLKGFANGRLGEWGLEQKYYEDALKLANENIAADKSGGRSIAEDRQVAKTAAENLAASWKPVR